MCCDRTPSFNEMKARRLMRRMPKMMRDFWISMDREQRLEAACMINLWEQDCLMRGRKAMKLEVVELGS